MNMIVLGVILFLIVAFFVNAIRIFREYERGVVFTQIGRASCRERV